MNADYFLEREPCEATHALVIDCGFISFGKRLFHFQLVPNLTVVSFLCTRSSRNLRKPGPRQISTTPDCVYVITIIWTSGNPTVSRQSKNAALSHIWLFALFWYVHRYRIEDPLPIPLAIWLSDDCFCWVCNCLFRANPFGQFYGLIPKGL